MSLISAVQLSEIVHGKSANKPYTNAGAIASTRDALPGSDVSISSAAIEMAENDQSVSSGLKVPDYMTGWFNKDFPPDVMNAARARLDDIKANGRLGADGPVNLPLLPENQKLLDDFRQEMKNIRSAGLEKATPAQSERFNLLMNLSMRLQLTGWEKPMAEADVQREFDISNAMAKLSLDDPDMTPGNYSGMASSGAISGRTGEVPDSWRQRWQNEGLVMPENVTVSPVRSMLLDVAQAAGIGEEEFLTKLRELSGDLKGSALTHAIESYISERYVALTESQKDQAA